MKLPDFYQFEPLNDLRRRMGLGESDYGSLEVTLDPPRLTVEELDKLISGEGIDVSFDELTILDDGTLAYKDSRVLLYIRDVHQYGDRDAQEPRYHVAHCRTLQDMTERGRFERYVIAAEASGEFELNFINKGNKRAERRRLLVCRNCLTKLRFERFEELSRPKKHEAVRLFTPEKFFRVYPRSLHSKLPTYNSKNAPIDDYPADWPTISRRTRAGAGWKCQKCNRNLSSKSLRQYLDVHHISGDRRDNSPRNLMVVCVGCHAEMPSHSHLKDSRRYRDYLAQIMRT